MTIAMRLLLFLLCLSPAWLAVGVSAQTLRSEHVDAVLVAETEAAVPGETLWLGLRLDHAPGWHTYWKNPGDAGKPTEIAWRLPAGVTAGDIVWPIPQRIELPADLVDFGYEDEIMLLIPLMIGADFSGDTLDIDADVNWLECEAICIPGGASVVLSLPVDASGPPMADPHWQNDFDRARSSLPRSDVSFDSTYSVADGSINLLVQATDMIFSEARSVRFIPGQHRVFDYNGRQDVTWQLSSLQLSQAHHNRLGQQNIEALEGLLVVTDGNGGQIAYEISAQPDGVSLAGLGATPPAPAYADISLALVFGFAVLGGLILNLMPCVFPVLSLKVMSLSAKSGAAASEQRLHGISYTAGVILSFLLLAAVLLTLRAAGSAIGWGFHLQSPWFVAALVYLFMLLGLAMAGVLELGAGFMGVGQGLTEEKGYWGSFFTGVLATVVASPCTAPFMGAALGFALTQSMPVALTIFAALGLGLALPFLLLSFVPALARMMPKPGRWMVTFKQILAIPLFATVLWLLWVLGRQTSTAGVALVFGSSILLGLAFWLFQRTKQRDAGSTWLRGGVVAASLMVAVSVLLTPQLAARDNDLAGDSDVYEVYSPARLAELRAAGNPVFVNMTASWCITCLVNERVALSSERFEAALKENNVTYLKGDWTNNDPEITAVLRQFRTSGVPLYLLYPADPTQEARVLPQILTESMVVDALNAI